MLQQCINLISAPNTGVGESNIVMALLPYILVIAAFALIFGVHLWRSNRFARRSAAHRPGRAGLLSLFAVASLAIGGLALTAQAFAQQIPIECQQYTTDDGSGGNDGSAPSEPTTMQSMTTDYCQNHMDTYTGSNEDSILSLTDSRGGIAQIYRVAKLADGNCWMLDNLKLGGTTTTTTLTPADSDVSQNFILPQVASAHAFIQLDKDVAYVWGPVPGDTGEGSTNYGYLYSWTAVTAGATRTTNPAGSGNASSSICAAGWKLPSGGAGGDYSKLDIAFGGAGSGNNFTPSYQEWQYTGPFKGVFSGAYWPPINPGGTPVTGTYVNQGIAGRWWTATADATNGDTAYRAGINTTYNSPAYPSGGQRYDGAAVRCVLQL